MLLHINDNKTIEDLQDHFNDCFPHLKLEFYSKPHKWMQNCSASDHLHPHSLIGNIRNNHNSGVMEIKSWYQTGKVEQDLEETFGLHVQIFRLHKGRWVQTSYSDELTLEQQRQLTKEYTINSVKNNCAKSA